ncbi:hypothetical protein YC2023_105018 [Brassica napus]
MKRCLEEKKQDSKVKKKKKSAKLVPWNLLKCVANQNLQSKGAYLYYSWEYFPKPENRTKKNQTDSQNPNGSYFVLRTQKLASAEINKTTTYVNGRVSRKGSIRDRKPELLLPLLFLASHLPLLLLAVPTEREISFFFFLTANNL